MAKAETHLTGGPHAIRQVHANPMWKLVGGAGSQTRICGFGRCRVVRLHYPPIGARAANPTRISSFGTKVRTEASSCLRPRQPN